MISARLLFRSRAKSSPPGARWLPPLMLDPVDFVGLYRQNMERQAAAQPPAPSRAEASGKRAKIHTRSASPNVATKARCSMRSPLGPAPPAVSRAAAAFHPARLPACRLSDARISCDCRAPIRSIRLRPATGVEQRAVLKKRCRSTSANRDRRAGSTRWDACAGPTAACRPAGLVIAGL